jgi:hypothetical protein
VRVLNCYLVIHVISLYLCQLVAEQISFIQEVQVQVKEEEGEEGEGEVQVQANQE